MRIICHMMISVDGRILSANWGEKEQTKKFSRIYEEVHGTFDSNAWICGRITMEKDFSKGRQPEIEETGAPVERKDYIADTKATTFAIAVDPSGKLGWESDIIYGDHLIEVLTEQVPDGYLRYLQKKGISYIFGGREELSFKTVKEKLASQFPIDLLMLEGGGYLNGSFLNEGLIDELSLLIVPIADGTPHTPTVFEVSDYLKKGPPTHMDLIEVKQMDEQVLWLHYKMKQDWQ